MTRMIRKQIYLEPRQEQKVKHLAEQRHTTEADVIREAIDGLNDPDDAVAKLVAAGILKPRKELPPELRGLDRAKLEKNLFDNLRKRGVVLNLTEAVLAEREASPY